MAKKIESKYKSWEDVNSALKELGELNIKKERLEGEQTVKINEIKADTLAKAGIITTQMKTIEKDIERFTDEHKSEFIKIRSKKLTFGTVSFRLVKSVFIKVKDEAIKSLKALNLDFCLKIKEEIDKEKCLEIDENILQKAGIVIKQEDKIRIEPSYVKLATNAPNNAD